MIHLLATTTLFLTVADHWTTYLCLRSPVPGWAVSEANPIADWLFQSAGLVPGLVIDSLVTLVAVVFLATTTRLPQGAKVGCFVAIAGFTGYAVANNLGALESMGIPLLAGVAS